MLLLDLAQFVILRAQFGGGAKCTSQGEKADAKTLHSTSNAGMNAK